VWDVRGADSRSTEGTTAFDIDQTFLFFTTLYIVVPTLMIYLTLVIRPLVNRVVNVVVAAAYALSGLGSAVGE
jgi:hypothetical protein